MKMMNATWSRLVSRRNTKSWIAAWLVAATGPAGLAQPQAGSVENALAALPPEAREQVEKQAAAVKAVYFEFENLEIDPDITVDGGRAKTFYSVYFEGPRFYRRSERLPIADGQRAYVDNREISFDGSFLYKGIPIRSTDPQAIDPTSKKPRTKDPGRASLTKYLVADATDPLNNKREWIYPYVEAAGFYAPVRINEIKQFTSVEPLVQFYLKQGRGVEVEPAGEYLRITVRVPDRVLVAARNMDIGKFRKYREAFPYTPEQIDSEVAWYAHLKTLSPELIVVLLLDPKHGYAIAEREEWTAAGERILRSKSEDWKFYDAAKVWLPQKCVTYDYHPTPLSYDKFSDQPVVTNITRLKVAEFGPKPIEFVLDYKTPGTLIEDRTVAEARANPTHQVLYTVAADGKLLRKSAGQVMNRHRYFIIILVLLALPPLLVFIRAKIGSRKA